MQFFPIICINIVNMRRFFLSKIMMFMPKTKKNFANGVEFFFFMYAVLRFQKCQVQQNLSGLSHIHKYSHFDPHGWDGPSVVFYAILPVFLESLFLWCYFFWDLCCSCVYQHGNHLQYLLICVLVECSAVKWTWIA